MTIPRSGLRHRSLSQQLTGLAGWIVLTALAAAIGGYASANAGAFYGQLQQPGWAPPAWWFGPVWTVLYLLMAIAAWRVWRSHGFGAGGPALTLYGVQLVANGLWTWLFFSWHQGALALAEIALLALLVVLTIRAFWRLDRAAAVMLLPYLLWVSFAAALNGVLWQLNPQVL